jgi:hypothetical protein
MVLNGQLLNEAGRLVARCEPVNILYHFAGGLQATRRAPGEEAHDKLT